MKHENGEIFTMLILHYAESIFKIMMKKFNNEIIFHINNKKLK